MEAAFAGYQTAALVYAIALFAVGATESLRFGLILAGLSVMASLLVARLDPGTWTLLASQLGVFIGIAFLRVAASALLPRRPRPERVSASHRHGGADDDPGEDFARGLLAAVAAGAILAAPFVLVASFAPRVDEDVWQFFLITGMLGVAIVLMVLWPYLLVLGHLALWLLRRKARREAESERNR